MAQFGTLVIAGDQTWEDAFDVADQVTVLFADLKGSIELLADRDPEKAREILDPSSS